MKRHLHFYYCSWQNESRAWRSGSTALKFGYASEILYIGYKFGGLEKEQKIAPNQLILRIGSEPAHPGSSRLLRALSLPKWWRACNKEISSQDVSLVIAHGLAALPGCVNFARKYRLPLLYDAHELETERQGWNWLVRRIAKIIESRLIRECDHVIVVNESIKEYYLNAYPSIDISVVRNTPSLPEKVGKSNMRTVLGIAEHAIVYVYCGALGDGRGLPQLVEAFRKFGPDRHLVLLGDGPGRYDLEEQAKGLKNVHFHPPVPYTVLVTFLTDADVGICVADSDSLSYHYGLPNKIFEYALAGLAICIGLGPEMRRFAESYPAAKIAEPTVESLRFTLSQWTREEISRLRPAISLYKAPNWDEESKKLLDAFDCALNTFNSK